MRTERRKESMVPFFIFFVIWFCSYWNIAVGEHCIDFNHAAARAAAAGVPQTYVCPEDGIARQSCADQFPYLKDVSAIVDSKLTFDDILIFALYHTAAKEELLFWWLTNFYRARGTAVLDLVLLADACGDGTETCDDDAAKLSVRLNKMSGVRGHIVRGMPVVDAGYYRLACKLLTGIHKMYEQFPNKKYYFKMDDDTVIFPSRILHMLNTLDSAAGSTTVPLLFGSVLNAHKAFLLCEPGYCMPSGGAGYGFNNAAFKTMTKPVYNWPCTKDMDLDRDDEDGYVGLRLMRESNTSIIHCGGFRPHGGYAEVFLPYAMSFHHVHHEWLSYQNVSQYKEDYNLN